MDKENQNLINLVVDTRNDVEGAFEKLYHESFRHAYCTASLLLKNEQDIEDVLQNSYMYVAKYIKDLKNPESFNNWLGVIVKHECQKHISKQKRTSDIFAAVKRTKEFDIIDSSSLPDDFIEKDETRVAIQRIIDNLPEDKKTCIILFYYEQHSLSEISEILGVPEGTVMSRLFYARKKLEKEFKKLQKKDESLLGISVIPFIVSLFAHQAKTIVVPSAIESGIITAVMAEGTAAVATTATAAVGSSAATVSTASATAASTSTATSIAGTAVAAKVTAVAVAASVAVGGGVATVNHIKSNSETVTTQTIIESTVEYATAANIIFEETTESISVSETTSTLSNPLTTSNKDTTNETVSEKAETTTLKQYKQTTTAKLSTTAKVTTTKPTTTKESTTKETTQQTTTELQETETKTEKEITTKNVTTTVEQTTNITDYFDVSDSVLSEYTGNESNVSIPSTVGSSSITAIGTGAFMGNTKITSVSIPPTVIRIGMEAFSDCTNLKSISLPSSLESIGVAAFYGCSSLTSITIPDGTKTISDEAFSYCDNLSSITIPDSVTSISDDAFYGSDNVVIKCSEGSEAHNYAVANSINFELI